MPRAGMAEMEMADVKVTKVQVPHVYPTAK